MEFIIKIIDNLFRFFIRFLRKALSVSVGIEKRLMVGRHNASAHRIQVIQSTKKYNMVSSLDEPYYREQYWYWIKKYLNSNKLPTNGTYLDLGCGQGRLSAFLAKSGIGKVIGVDFSESAIQQARNYANDLNLSNVEYFTEDILSFIKSKKVNSFDGILLLEVVFFLPKYKLVLKEIKRILKPNGLLFVSFRPQYFNILHMVSHRDLNEIDMILKSREGRLYNGDVHYTWQTSSEIATLMGKELKFDVLDLYAIGCCSGIEGDPHDSIARPSFLNEDEKKKMMQLEIALADSIPDAGRYILCVARKK